jgi:hypothetical protein
MVAILGALSFTTPATHPIGVLQIRQLAIKPPLLLRLRPERGGIFMELQGKVEAADVAASSGALLALVAPGKSDSH